MKLGHWLCAALSAAIVAAAPAVDLRAADVQTGGTLQVAVDLEPASLDPIFGNAPGSDRRFYNLFAENLIYQDANGDFQPMLAESWDYAEDGKSITFKLREDVVFQDGTPFDAEAAKFNLDRVSDPEVGARALQFVGNLESAEVIDPYTLRVNMKEPSAAFMSVLAIEPGSMLSPTAIEAMGDDFHRQPVGTGPFKITSWTSNKIEAERFADYWGKDDEGRQLPYLDGVVARVISNTAVKIVELRGGSLHLGDSIQIKDYSQVESDPQLVLMPTTQGTTQYMAFNLTRPPFDNMDLRAAVAHAINREALERAISRGEGIVLTGLKPPASLAYSPDVVGHSYDPDKARELYAASGHSGTLTLSVIQRDPDTQIAQILQSMLGEVGIDLRIEVLERQAWLDKVLGRTYELGILRATLPRPDPDISFSTYWGREARQDFSGINSPVLHDLIDEARVERDVEKRRALYGQAQQYINDNYFQTYFLWRPAAEVRRVELQGMDSEYSGSWRYAEMWLEE